MKNRIITEVLNWGVPLSLIAFVLFIGLRVAHFIDWSWWWVCAPAYFPMAVVISAFIWAYTRMK